MSYPIKQDLIAGLPEQPYRNGVGAWEGVVSHSTATPNASDENEDSYYHRVWQQIQAFPHVFCDWDSITQIAKFEFRGWGAGNGNPRYVHVELCETSDPNLFAESYKRYVWVIAYLLKMKNLGVTDGKTLVSHDWVSKNLGGTNHSDPIAYLASHGVSWSQHVANVAAAYNGSNPSPQPQPSPSPTNGSLVGQTVTVRPNASFYATGEPIAAFVRGSKHKAIQEKPFQKSFSKKAYLLDGIMSWVLEQDIVESGVNNVPTPPPQPQPVPQPSVRKVVLGANEPSWTVYKLGHPCVKSNPNNIAGTLKPSKFGGLTYDILKDNGNYIFEIQTGDFGRVQIYAAPSTGARII